MKTKLTLLASTAAAALVLATPAQAAGTWYVGVFGGANWATDQSNSAATAPTVSADTITWSTDGEAGWIVGGAVGVNLNELMGGLRLEAEVAYRQNTVDGLWTTFTGVGGTSSGTLDIDHSTFSVMANLWYDFDVGGITPYIGGGVGWAETELDVTYLPPPGTAFNFSDSGFAWQLGAGVNFPISPNVKLGVGYRYFEGPDVTVGAFNNATMDIDNENHSAIVNLTFGM